MANRRVLVKRRDSVRNIRKITRTMQLIATARFQAAFTRAIAGKPYSDKLSELVADLSRAADGLDHPLMKKGESGRSALVVITSNRGLCGGYNSNILRLALQHLKTVEGAGQQVDTTMVGKKGDAYFRFLGREVSEQNTEIGDKVTFDQVEPLANRLIQRFVDGEIDAVHVAYTRFYSVGKQSPELLQLLPLEPVSSEPVADAPESGNQAASGGSQRNVEYEFSPAPQALLDDLLPASFRIRLFQSFTDAEVSEQVARMVAMKAATDAAGDMITSLTRKYNRARQTHITMELLDIIGGASALE